MYGVFAATMVTVTAAALWLVLRRGPPEEGVEGEGCGASVCPAAAALPEGPSFGSETAAAVVWLWVDVESAASRQVFQAVTRVVAESRGETGLQLRLLHLPAGPCGGGQEGFACVGARLIECAEGSRRGAGVRVAGALFDLQWLGAEEGRPAAAAGAIAGLGLDAAQVGRCAEDLGQTEAALGRHAAAAQRHGLAQAPGGLVVDRAQGRRMASFGAWLTEGGLRAIVGCLMRDRCQEAA